MALTAEQQANFEATQARLGLRPDQFSQEGPLRTRDHGGKLVLSPDPDVSHVAPIQVSYRSMAELKAMAGVPDEHVVSGRSSDRHIKYPEPLPSDRVRFLLDAKNVCDLRHHLTDEEEATLRAAQRAYLLGDSARVATHETLMDAHFTPGTLAVFAGKELEIDPGQTVEIDPGPNGAPVAMNFQEVTVDSGGGILVNDVPLLFVSQVFNART